MTTEFGEKRPDVGEQVTSIPLYRDLLIRATLKDHNRAISDDITAIDFSGPFAETANKLNRLTQTDSRKREHGTLAYLTSGGRVLIKNKITRGDEAFVSVYAEITPHFAKLLLPRAYKQDRFIASHIHSHPVDSPPSPMDLSHLLLTSKETFAQTSILVVTPDRRILVLRGSQTPQLSQKEVEAKLTLWTRQVDERITHFTKLDMDADEINDIKARAQWAMLRQIIKKYDLKYFTCPAEQTVARLNLQGEL